MHPQCVFPERYRFLKKRLLLDIQDVECSVFKEWVKKINPKSVTLVFASNFPNNPGSALGHTFLRINSNYQRPQKDLLDYAISYAANDDQSNPVIFALKGLLGGYEGRFAIQPYYMKIHDYNNMESRDVWEYNLNINSEETIRLLSHLWEIESTTYFNYYFLDENCASLLLTLLEIAKPEWELQSGFFIYISPADIVKKMYEQKNAVSEVKFRPSLYKQATQYINMLNNTQYEVFKDIASQKLDPGTNNDYLILQASANYMLFKKYNTWKTFKVEEDEFYRKILLALSKTYNNADNTIKLPQIDSSSRPEESHGSWNIGTSAGFHEDITFQELHFKAGLHDFVNMSEGFDPFTRIDFLKIRLRYYYTSRDNSDSVSSNSEYQKQHFSFGNLPYSLKSFFLF